jgi:hypothetical protein
VTPELANNPGEAETPKPELAEEAEAEAEVQDLEQEIDPETGQPVTRTDDTEEVEHDGQKYKLPKALKGALLMQQDYTRKTQEVAEQRRALEERDAAFRQHAAAATEHIKLAARIEALNDQLGQFEKIDWATYQAQDATGAQSLWFSYQKALHDRNQTASELQAKVTNWQQTNAAESARRSSELPAILARDIPGYSTELVGKMQDYGIREFGFSPDEIRTTTDPRLHKLLHRAMLGEAAIKRESAAKRLVTQQGVQPAPQVGSRANATQPKPSTAAADRLSTEKWMQARTQELRKKG